MAQILNHYAPHPLLSVSCSTIAPYLCGRFLGEIRISGREQSAHFVNSPREDINCWNSYTSTGPVWFRGGLEGGGSRA